MKISEALRIINHAAENDGSILECNFVSGITPLHLKTLLQAELIERASSRVTLTEGIFGDLIGNLERLGALPASRVIVVLEWSDLDPRLGYRTSGGWRHRHIGDVVKTVEFSLARLAKALSALNEKNSQIVLVGPTLPLPPMFMADPQEKDPAEIEIRHYLSKFFVNISRLDNIKQVSPQQLEMISPLSERFDLTSDIRSGFPYSKKHAGHLAALISPLVYPIAQMKGIITDLDNTLWHGIVGDDGVDGVSWDLVDQQQKYALYQEMLASLAEQGVLIAVASKNDPQVIKSAFEKMDLIVPKDKIYPIEVNWGAKSESIARILKAWNIFEDSVAFIDDSDVELAEVKARFPNIHCLKFPHDSDQKVLELITALRTMYGKRYLTEEDKVRVEGIKANAHYQNLDDASDLDSFVRELAASIHIKINETNQRSFELINKTNQFNLNGRRIGDATWRNGKGQENRFTMAVSYTDKFGPLGQISVACGEILGNKLVVDTWVMSCRAFSRRIEYQIVKQLFDWSKKKTIVFAFEQTDRNGVISDFLSHFCGEDIPCDAVLTHDSFFQNYPELSHEVTVE